MTFSGWPAEAIEFFEGLEADNSKSYWQDHKPVYDKTVRAPMQALVDELCAEFGAGKISRPNRDTRFSASKAPYKTNIYAKLGGDGYVSFSAEGVAAGRGLYMLMPDQLDRFRRAVSVDKSGAALEAVVVAVRKLGLEIGAHDVLKTAPKGYAKDHPRIELLRHKGLYAWRQWPVASWMGTRKAKTRIEQVLREAEPLATWLDHHVGPTTMSLKD